MGCAVVAPISRRAFGEVRERGEDGCGGYEEEEECCYYVREWEWDVC